MTGFAEKLLIGLFVLVFLVVCLGVARPLTGKGKFSLKLCIANAVGWLLVLAFPDSGHPPPSLIVLIGFWLINLVRLPAAAMAGVKRA